MRHICRSCQIPSMATFVFKKLHCWDRSTFYLFRHTCEGECLEQITLINWSLNNEGSCYTRDVAVKIAKMLLLTFDFFFSSRSDSDETHFKSKWSLVSVRKCSRNKIFHEPLAGLIRTKPVFHMWYTCVHLVYCVYMHDAKMIRRQLAAYAWLLFFPLLIMFLFPL